MTPLRQKMIEDMQGRDLGVVQIRQPPAIVLYTLQSGATTKTHDRQLRPSNLTEDQVNESMKAFA